MSKDIHWKEFEVAIPNSNKTAIAYYVLIQIPVEWDSEAGEWLLTVEAHELIDRTKIEHGMVKPEKKKG